jgi:hypothetical protein
MSTGGCSGLAGSERRLRRWDTVLAGRESLGVRFRPVPVRDPDDVLGAPGRDDT